MKKAVCVALFKDDKIYCITRKDNPDKVSFIGGKVDDGETPEEAIARETFEEAGITLINIRLLDVAIDDNNYETYLFTGDMLGHPKKQENEGDILLLTPEEFIEKSAFPQYDKKMIEKHFLNINVEKFQKRINLDIGDWGEINAIYFELEKKYPKYVIQVEKQTLKNINIITNVIEKSFLLAYFSDEFSENKLFKYKDTYIFEFTDGFKVISNLEFIEKIKSNIINKKEKQNGFNILTFDKNNLKLQYVELKDQKYDINLHYNYPDEIKNFTKLLNNNENGLYIIHGPAGTGKTSLIRYLIKKTKKQVVYITKNNLNLLINEGTINFFIREATVSLIILEDCEEIIKSRESENNPYITTLLNITDGMLSDALNCKIICTFNTKYENIDTALTRPGRLKGRLNIDKLSIEKSQKLFNKLYPKNSKILDKEYSLAKLFNFFNDMSDNKETKKIGF